MLVLLVPAVAPSDLIKQMEMEIEIGEIIDEVYEDSLNAASVAVKKTSLYAKYRKAQDEAYSASYKHGEEVKRYEQASRDEFVCEMNARSALRDRGVAILSESFAETYNSYRSHVCKVAGKEVSLRELRARTKEAKAEKGRALDESVRLSTVSARVLSEVVKLTEKFKWKLYWAGIDKRLKEHGVEITVDISRILRSRQLDDRRIRDTICVYLPSLEDCSVGR